MSDEDKGYVWAILVVLVFAIVVGIVLYASGASTVADSWCRSLGYDSGEWTYVEKTVCKTINIEKLYPQGPDRRGFD